MEKNPVSTNKTLLNAIILSHLGQHAHYYALVLTQHLLTKK